jgi:hypothetical protein
VFDVIIVGGSYAGMAAALQLARGRRDVLVIDAGVRRNRFADTSHGVLGQDGKEPSDIVSTAKAQLTTYPNVSWVDGTVVSVGQSGDGFVVRTKEERSMTAKQLVLATGVRDELPEIPGLAERWGKFVFHCPYCHGYELDQGPLGVLATSEASMHQALLIPEWGPTTFFTNGVFEPDEAGALPLAEFPSTACHDGNLICHICILPYSGTPCGEPEVTPRHIVIPNHCVLKNRRKALPNIGRDAASIGHHLLRTVPRIDGFVPFPS